MKKVLLSLLLLFITTNVWSATNFTVTVKESGGDYSSLGSATNALRCNLITSVVMSHSGIVGTLSDGATVTGATSGATGTLVHATSTQIAIRGVTGTFQSGEQVYSTLGTNYVLTTSAPDSIQLTVKIDGTWTTSDSSTTLLASYSTPAWATSSTNNIVIYTTATARHPGYWSTSGGAYRLLRTINDGTFSIAIGSLNYVTISGIQAKVTSTGYNYGSGPFYMNSSDNIVFDSVIGINNQGSAFSIADYGVSSFKILNSVAISNGATGITSPAIIINNYSSNSTNHKIYNTVAIKYTSGNAITVNTNSAGLGGATITNCYAHAVTGSAYGTTGSAVINSTTNASSDLTGTAGLQSVAYDTASGARFTNTTPGSENFTLNASSALILIGTNLSGTFTNDILGTTRQPSGSWEIGPFKYTAPLTGSLFNSSVLKNAIIN